MGWLDNVIATVSPRRAYEREMWRQGLDELRGYDAAGHGRINSGCGHGRGTWSETAI